MPTEPISPFGTQPPKNGAEQFSTDHLKRAPRFIHHHVQDPLRPNEWRNCLKRLTSIGRMVEHSPADNEIELRRLERKSEQIRLNHLDVREMFGDFPGDVDGSIGEIHRNYPRPQYGQRVSPASGPTTQIQDRAAGKVLLRKLDIQQPVIKQGRTDPEVSGTFKLPMLEIKSSSRF